MELCYESVMDEPKLPYQCTNGWNLIFIHNFIQLLMNPKFTHPSKHTNWHWYWIFLVNFHTNLVVALGSKADFWVVSEGYIPDIEFGTALK